MKRRLTIARSLINEPDAAAARRADDRPRPAGAPPAVGAAVPAQAAGRDARPDDALHGRGRAAVRPARRHGQGEDRRRGLAAPADRRSTRPARWSSCASRSASRRRSTASSTGSASGSRTCPTGCWSTPTTARRPSPRPTQRGLRAGDGARPPAHARGRVPAADRPHAGRLMAVATWVDRRRDGAVRAATAWRARGVRAHVLLYRRTWRGSIFGTFLTPVLFLARDGRRARARSSTRRTARRSAACRTSRSSRPGLLARPCMQTAAFECDVPGHGRHQLERRYHAMLATPLTPADDRARAASRGSRPGRRSSATIFRVVIVAVRRGRLAAGIVLAIPVGDAHRARVRRRRSPPS